ncbi:hypothetical protein ALT_5348 [Aspergillus lentulus]|uniref:Uncharacterized protein n=1 Tax=Aspergillus lentulus TaxID=293939 RepID=A0AAN4PJX6_ASPLE|nr:hypothetical protein CNMCM6069_000719 [Aspergillus lentulus]KAF4163667.1 hypothetical protein CNMCM6936_000521 [Aspergillus lentulus]KAF4171271.1 hypothetical protein CNMCM8060_003163 [Aspergillus lentulus]KAF4177639.1 hypothetical protein CNMCM7927_003032 [Aspergillus lentulus]KAF4190312.1 hypothetical protein CNMCM8694_003742 [Aspergillus lentulus]
MLGLIVPATPDLDRSGLKSSSIHLSYFFTWTNDTTAAAAATAPPPPTADPPGPATNKRKLCHICGKSHTGDCWPLCGTCGRRHPADKPCRPASRRQPAARRRQPPTVVNNITINGDGHSITISAHPLSAGDGPPPGKKPRRRKRPDKAKGKEEKKEKEEGEKEVEPAEEGEKPSSE